LAVKNKTTKKKVATKKKATTKNNDKKINTKTQSSTKLKSKKPAFGGYSITFSGRKETVEEVFGNKPIAPSEMTKKIWAFVKAKSLSNR
jgi:Tfp pilus assembly major pilin PilA